MDITSTSVGVKVQEPSENNVIKRFEVSVKGGTAQQACTIKVNSDPLLCTLSGLSPSHDYTVDVKSSVHGIKGCGLLLKSHSELGMYY